MGLITDMTTKLAGVVRPVSVSLKPFSRRSAAFSGLVAILGFFTACVAVGAPKTNDPAKKLNHARLLLRDDRPLPAERLISESMKIYQSREDQGGLADAQSTYAQFLVGDAVEGMAGWYRDNGFRDSSASFDSRRREGARYFHLAATNYTQIGDFADATNAYFDLGIVQSRFDDREPACRAFTDSLKSFYNYLRWDPALEVRVPNGVASYEEYVITPAVAAGCPVAAELIDQSEEGADDRNARELALVAETLVLARDILGPNHTAITGISEFRQQVFDRQRRASE
ncbi:MAG: hypothetical protein ACRBM6_25390 [Geminicoccales bacterium]